MSHLDREICPRCERQFVENGRCLYYQDCGWQRGAEPRHEREALNQILPTVEAAFHMMKARDEMNADIHLEAPRYSPLTTGLQWAAHLVTWLLRQTAPDQEALTDDQ